MKFTKDHRNEIKQIPGRGFYDKDTIYKIVDEALVCHIGFSAGNNPFIIPINHARKDDIIYVHGSPKSRLINHLKEKNSVCLSFTLIDGLVLARSVFHHSINYRSAILFGKGRPVNEKEKIEAFELITEKLIPGRWKDSRHPNEKELKTTSVAAIDFETGSAKIRSGGVNDDKDDYESDYWAGIIPIKQTLLNPLPDGRLKAGIEVPDYIKSKISTF